jgi:hypothetical protein
MEGSQESRETFPQDNTAFFAITLRRLTVRKGLVVDPVSAYRDATLSYRLKRKSKKSGVVVTWDLWRERNGVRTRLAEMVD